MLFKQWFSSVTIYTVGTPLVHTYLLKTHLQFNSHFQVKLGSTIPPQFSSFICPRRKPLSISGTVFYGCIFFLPLNHQCQSTDPNHWPRLISSSSSTGLQTPDGSNIAAFMPAPCCQYHNILGTLIDFKSIQKVQFIRFLQEIYCCICISHLPTNCPELRLCQTATR